MGNINFALNAPGCWLLAPGRFSMGESSLIQIKVKNKSQLVTAIQANRQ
jgi:hypothetical protein